MNVSTRPMPALRGLALALACVPPLPATAMEFLSEVYAAAEAADPQLAGQRATLDATRELRPQAEAVVNKPRLTGGGGINYNYQEIDAVFGGGLARFDGRNWSINLSQPIYRADRRARLSQADSQIRAQELRVDATRQGLVTRVVDAYFNVLGATDNLGFAEAEQDSLARQLEQTKERFDVGLIAITDVQEAQAGYDLAVSQAIMARNGLDQALEALREITGQYHEALIPLATEFEPSVPEPADIEAWTKTALEQNLTVGAALAESEAAGLAISVAEAGRHPTVDAVGSTDFRKTGGQFGAARVFGGAVGLEVNVPLYMGGEVTSRTREAGHRHEAALQALEQARRQAHRGARDAFNAIVNGVSRIQALRQAVVSTETALEATQAGFEVGTRTTVEVVAAERDVSRARRDYARARYDYIVASVRLREAAGTLDPLVLKEIDAFLVSAPPPTGTAAPPSGQDRPGRSNAAGTPRTRTAAPASSQDRHL